MGNCVVPKERPELKYRDELMLLIASASDNSAFPGRK